MLLDIGVRAIDFWEKSLNFPQLGFSAFCFFVFSLKFSIKKNIMRSTLALVRASYTQTIKRTSIRPVLSLSQRGKRKKKKETRD